jgi:hypothetical protein
MLLTHYYAIAACAGLLTGAWLFRPQERTAITTLGAFLAWGLVGLLGGDTEVATGGSVLAAPVPDEIRLFATLWALLSALALVLYVWGVYPPASEEPVDQAAGVDTQ